MLIGFYLPVLAFEFGALSATWLCCLEQVPEQRGKMLTFGAMFGLIGTALAGITSSAAYTAV
ncbi:MAG: hypothetical protein IPL78_09720 [Chloroflexi bacterium]|nr:hypothetical protein [Chloroflexota bacterium]